ncbi:MAG: hypothetical protein PHS32_07335 [Rhodoferax sp.]|uniref:hypothetical protein n=1 Tax=Rhodoferax sp. TaxID=50421 RepID=UPI00262E5928|nr:hypothetical protein [Rhodoferax sp.]MDD5333543.1 hypothetical protein [Rhodoferax sp.]
MRVISRYGHAMAIPTPRASGQLPLHLSSIAHRPSERSERPAISHERLSFAHSDWAGYSVFEEAFTLGHYAV